MITPMPRPGSLEAQSKGCACAGNEHAKDCAMMRYWAERYRRWCWSAGKWIRLAGAAT